MARLEPTNPRVTAQDGEWRTLAEHDVKPGDVVEWDTGLSAGRETIPRHWETWPGATERWWRVISRASQPTTQGERVLLLENDFGDPHRLDKVEIGGVEFVRRAPQPAPAIDTTNPHRKPWRDMTDAEKGALLLAHHRGEAIEFLVGDDWSYVKYPVWEVEIAYRTRPPAPKRETVTLRGNADRGFDFSGWGAADTHTLQFDTLDGKPDCASVRMEEIKTP